MRDEKLWKGIIAVKTRLTLGSGEALKTVAERHGVLDFPSVQLPVLVDVRAGGKARSPLVAGRNRVKRFAFDEKGVGCLLYTSDAADE